MGEVAEHCFGPTRRRLGSHRRKREIRLPTKRSRGAWTRSSLLHSVSGELANFPLRNCRHDVPTPRTANQGCTKEVPTEKVPNVSLLCARVLTLLRTSANAVSQVLKKCFRRLYLFVLSCYPKNIGPHEE